MQWVILLKFLDDNVAWVMLKLLGATGALRSLVIKIINFLLQFGYALEDFREVLAYMADLLTNFFPPWATYFALMTF